MSDLSRKPSSHPETRPGRRSRKKRRTRRQIHQAAQALFAECGYDGVSLDRICEAADVARGTFFLHFPSKAALLHEVDRQLADELRAGLAGTRGSALAEYRMLVDHLCRLWPARPDLGPDLLAAVLRARPPSHELHEPDGAAGGRGLRAVVAAIVRRGQERRELGRAASPRLLATLLLSASAVLLADAADAGQRVVPAPLRRELLHALLHGTAPGKPRLKWSPSVAAAATPERDA